MDEHLATLQEMREKARLGGGANRIEQQHERGKLTARERISLLLDTDSFQELGAFATHTITDFEMAEQRYLGDGVVTGFGRINGREVGLFAQDFTVLGGSFSEVQANKICRMLDLALENGVPVIGLNDSGGARIQEGVRSLAAYGEMFTRNVLASGVIPQISVMLGPCAGGSVYSPALTDFVIMTQQTSFMVCTGPEVVKAVTGEDVTLQELGGSFVHNTSSGVAHFLAADEPKALELVKHLLSYLPQNNLEAPPALLCTDLPNRMEETLNSIIPLDESEPYDMYRVLESVFDRNSFLEIQPLYARSAIIGFARLHGNVVGIVANQPKYLAGALDNDSSDKIARFIRICDAYNIPLTTFVDSPGFMPGVAAEHHGAIRHGAKVIFAYCEATVPKISVVIRKAIGGAYIAMSSKQMRGDIVYAWPTAQIAVLGAEGAIRILRRRELAQAADPQALEQKFVQEYRQKFANPYSAAQAGQVDEIIEPRETRPRLIRALELLRNKVQQNPPKKHALMPM